MLPHTRTSRWRSWLVATALATLGAIVAVPATAQASVTSDFTLHWSHETNADSIPMKKASMTAVLGDGLYHMAQTGACTGGQGTAGLTAAWCFDSNDTSSSSWTPQGVTTTSDEESDESWNSIPAAIISWYDAGDVRGIRISVVNLNDHSYRHVLLAEPTVSGGADTFEAVKVHAGGILWYGRNLYVVDTNHGVREFSMDEIYDLGASGNGTTSCDYIGLRNGVYCASQYKYVMMQVGSWQTSTGSSSANYCTSTPDPRFSYITVDRASTPDRMVVGEFCGPKDSSTETSNGRLVAYPMADAAGSTGVTTLTPVQAWTLPKPYIQGAAYDGTHWFFNTSWSSDPGQLVKADDSMHVVATFSAPLGAEDLSLWRTQHILYSVSEKPGERMFYEMPSNL